MNRFNPDAYGNPTPKRRPVQKPTKISTSEDEVQMRSSQTSEHLGTQSSKSISDVGADRNERNVPHSEKTAENKMTSPKASRNTTNGLLDSKFAPSSAELNVRPAATDAQPQRYARFKSLNSGVLNVSHQTATLAGNNEKLDQGGCRLLDEDATCEAQKAVLTSLIGTSPDPPLNSQSTSSEQANTSAFSDTKAAVLESKELDSMAPSSRATSNRGPRATPLRSSEAQQLTTEEMLDVARQKQLKNIQLRNKGNDKHATTSLRDLDLARKPHWDTVSSKHADIKSFRSDTRTRNSAQTHRSLLNEQAADGSRFAIRADLKDTKTGPGSGSREIQISDISNQVKKESTGQLNITKTSTARFQESSHPLAGWDGAFQPPPTDWDDRPRFDTDVPEFHDDMARWNHDVCQLTIGDNDRLFTAIPHEKLRSDLSNPDGISMVPKDTTITKSNADRYGYQGPVVEEALKYTQPIDPKDDEDWGKLDASKPENTMIMNETTNDLVANWTRHIEERRRIADAHILAQEQSVNALLEYKATPNPNKPALNIYLRPACGIDIAQMARIYNWYVENSPRPAETVPIDNDEMASRFANVNEGKLPFIVAVQRNLKDTVPYDLKAEAEAFENDPHPIKNIDPKQKSMVAQEKIVGWACAQDFTAMDFVERISAELEIYVDPAYCCLGVGKCLMDQLLEACDRGYMKRGDFSFHCPGEYKHLYTSGGGRDLHKLVFIVRKWKYPKNAPVQHWPHKHAKMNLEKKAADGENDYEQWLKTWLASWDFEVEGTLKGAGAKNGRYVDIVHFGRETRWQPAEGRIPDPIPFRQQV